MLTLIFAAIYKIMPRAHIEWRDVWVGAAVTAVLLTIGKFLIGLYLGKSDIGSSFGTFGSIIIVMVWVYYSAQIFLLGKDCRSCAFCRDTHPALGRAQGGARSTASRSSSSPRKARTLPGVDHSLEAAAVIVRGCRLRSLSQPKGKSSAARRPSIDDSWSRLRIASSANCWISASARIAAR